jgi:nitroimidazol reductase NimA-like FMN-containing flavoprotein (pyridoxamine 5'-phosphate oxidase superfamily)
MASLRMTTEEREAFLAEPHVGVLSVNNDGGRPPLSVPVWYSYEPGGNLTFFTGTQGRTAQKTALIERAGAISFTVQYPLPPYKYVTIEGSVIGVDRPPSAHQVLAIVRRYLPEEQAQQFTEAELGLQSPSFALFTIRPDTWLTSDFGKLEE